MNPKQQAKANTNAPSDRVAASAHNLQHTLRLARLDWQVLTFDQVDSTMEAARDYLTPGKTLLVFSRKQTQGRGRRGRTWHSPEGGAYFTLALHPRCTPTQFPQLALLAGFSLSETIRHLSGLEAQVKWPNDVLLQGKKVAGILIEAQNSAVMIGVGININTPEAGLLPGAVSLASVAGKYFDPVDVTARFCERFEQDYICWERYGFGAILLLLRPLMALFGQVVHVQSDREKLQGTLVDVDAQGRLVLRLDSGVQRTIDAGDVSLLSA